MAMEAEARQPLVAAAVLAVAPGGGILHRWAIVSDIQKLSWEDP